MLEFAYPLALLALPLPLLVWLLLPPHREVNSINLFEAGSHPGVSDCHDVLLPHLFFNSVLGRARLSYFRSRHATLRVASQAALSRYPVDDARPNFPIVERVRVLDVDSIRFFADLLLATAARTLRTIQNNTCRLVPRAKT